MEELEELLEKSVLEGFLELFDEPSNLKDFETYYSTLTRWAKDNIEVFSATMLNNTRLDVLLDVDPKEYIVDYPEISLSMEKDRMQFSKPDEVTASILAMSIADTLWELVTLRSGKDCPVCIYSELRYFIAQIRETKTRKLALECETCGWTEKLDGTEWDEGLIDEFPANKEDLMKEGIFI
jgi:DNA-directed RNA polymerase subunit M/transcription elongation factor TFIIS